MSIEVPDWKITRRISRAIRAGKPIDLACTAVGVDAPTLKRWLALGEAAYLEYEEEDPHCRFFEAFVKALEYADSHLEDDPQPIEPKLIPPSQPQVGSKPTESNRASESSPLPWLVIEEAPIEIVLGSRPAWVYETDPKATSVQAPEPLRPTQFDPGSSEETLEVPTSPAEVDETEPRHEPTLGEAVGVLLVALIVLILALMLALAVIPVALAGFALIGAIRLVTGLAFRWRAGLIALGAGSIEGLPLSGSVIWTACGKRPQTLGMVSVDRTAGSVSLSGRLRPQRE